MDESINEDDIQVPVSAPDDSNDLRPIAASPIFGETSGEQVHAILNSTSCSSNRGSSLPDVQVSVDHNLSLVPSSAVSEQTDTNHPVTTESCPQPVPPHSRVTAATHSTTDSRDSDHDVEESNDSAPLLGPQPGDDVPLLDLSADPPQPPLNPEDQALDIVHVLTHNPEDHTTFLHAIQTDIFAQILSKATTGDPEPQGGKNDNCCDIYCGKSCHITGDACRQRPLLIDSLVCGRNVGWNIFLSIVFPLVSNIRRRVWIASLWIPALALSCLSLATIILSGVTEIADILHIVLCGVFILFCVLDTTGSEICHFQLTRNKARAYGRHTAGESDNNGDERSTEGVKKWQRISDFVRLTIPELILFPILVCDLYSLVIHRTYTGRTTADLMGFVKLLVSCLTLLIHSHVVRLAIIATTTHRLHTKRAPPIELLEHDHLEGVSQQSVIDPSPRRAGLRYWNAFAVHAVVQILNQMLLIVGLGVKLQDYLVWTEAKDHNPNVYFHEGSTIKLEVACFMIGAYLLPVLGLWLFFVVTYYWLHEFLIGLAVDFVGMLQLPGADRFFFPSDDAESRNDSAQQKVSKIMEYTDFVNLKQLHVELCNKSSIEKLLYTFRNCVLTLLCVAYCTLQVVYLSFAFVNIKDRGSVSGVISVIAVIAEVLSNFNVFVIGAFWIISCTIVVLAVCSMYARRCDTPTRYYAVQPYNTYPVQRQYATTVPRPSVRTGTSGQYRSQPRVSAVGQRYRPLTVAGQGTSGRYRSQPRMPAGQQYRPQSTAGRGSSGQYRLTMARGQPMSGYYYPTAAVTGRPTTGQTIVQQNLPHSRTVAPYNMAAAPPPYSP